MHAIRSWLFVGKYLETQDVALLNARGIGAMLQLAEYVPQSGIATRFVHIEDGEPLPIEALREGIEFMRLQKSLGRKVLIACGAGISRSATFVVAALKEEEGLALLTAFRELRAAHPEALPHPNLWKSLCEYYAEPVSYLAVMRVAQGGDATS